MNAHDYVNASWVNISELFQKGLIKSKIMIDPDSGFIGNSLYFTGNEEAEEGWI